MIAPDPLMTIEVEVGAPAEVGQVHGQGRRFVPILGGRVSGGLHGRVMPGGADWQRVAPAGTLEIDARYVLDLAQGLVEVRSNGLRHASAAVSERLARGEAVDVADYYFRTALRFHTASPGLARLNSLLAIARGERRPGLVRLSVHIVT